LCHWLHITVCVNTVKYIVMHCVICPSICYLYSVCIRPNSSSNYLLSVRIIKYSIRYIPSFLSCSRCNISHNCVCMMQQREEILCITIWTGSSYTMAEDVTVSPVSCHADITCHTDADIIESEAEKFEHLLQLSLSTHHWHCCVLLQL